MYAISLKGEGIYRCVTARTLVIQQLSFNLKTKVVSFVLRQSLNVIYTVGLITQLLILFIYAGDMQQSTLMYKRRII